MTDQESAGPKPEARSGRARRWVKRGAIVLALVLVAGTTAGYFYYRHLEGNIEHITPDLGVNRPDPGPKGPLNVLLIGSDERVAGGGVSGEGGDLSDTTILLHLSDDRSRAYGVSIPRDLLVDRPVCGPKTKGGADVPGERSVMFNTAYQVGGPSCTWRTVEAMTDIRIDHIVVVRFDGFKRMVDALGGVPVCVPQEIRDDVHRIHLRAGSYEISGDQALAYVRARYGVGDGTDIGRIKRQQAFLAAMTNKAVSLGTLVNPMKLLPFLEAVTESIQTDAGIGTLRSLATQLKNIGLDEVKFLTMPLAIPPEDINRRIPGPGAGSLWRRLKHDEPLTRTQLSGSITAARPPGGGPKATPGSPRDDEAEREAVGLCA
jgi:LCP family protein required for cell wall assembly